MRLTDPVAVGDLVYWNDPRTPKRGLQTARALDVAGPWVLIQPEFGPRRTRRYWILASKLVHTITCLDPVQRARGLLKLAGLVPLEEGDPPLLPAVDSEQWRKCLVCQGLLQEVHIGGLRLKNWMHCPTCDRMQRLP